MNDKISVIVPVYNLEKYLAKCLDSIISQSYPNIELICVDDASSDNSLDILNEYSKKYKQIKVVELKQNGIFSPRNEGLKYATGKYIGFVDCDDFIETQTYEKAYLMMKKHDADIVCWGANIVFDDLTEPNEFALKELNKAEFSGFKELNDGIISKTTFAIWNKLFKASIIYENNVLATQGLVFEDYEFFYKYISHCKNIYFIKENLYNYVQHSKSITSCLNNCDERYLNHIIIFEKIYNHYKKFSFLKSHEELLLYIFADAINAAYKSSTLKEHAKEKISHLISKLEVSKLEKYKEIYNKLLK